MNNEFRSSISALKQLLQEDLPGSHSHIKMSPGRHIVENGLVDYKKAGVLLLMYIKNNRIFFPLIRRSEYPGTHSGQISLPGGKSEAGDSSLVETAIRESEEEIGVVADHIELLGQLSPLYIPVSNYMVYPSIGIYDKKPVFVIDESEVQEVIEIDLIGLMRVQKSFFTTNIQGIPSKVPCFAVKKSPPIWGATAMILTEFIDIIRFIPDFHKYFYNDETGP